MLRFLLLSAVCFTCAAANCDNGVLNAIKLLRKGKDDSGVINIAGDYVFIYAAGSKSVPGGFSSSTCQISNFFIDKQGKHRVAHTGVLGGGYILVFKDGAEQVIDSKTNKVLRLSYVVYASADFKIIAFYSCDLSGTPVSVGTIGVAKASLKAASTAKMIDEAKQSLAKVGLKFGVDLKGCKL